HLVIVLLAVDIATGVIQHPVEFHAFFRREVAVGPVAGFSSADAGLFAFKFTDFLRGKFTAADSLADSPLFLMLASIDGIGSGKQAGRQDYRAHNGSEH